MDAALIWSLLTLANPNNISDNISKVYVLFSNHLDIGCTENSNGSTSGAVCLFNVPLPRALQRTAPSCNWQVVNEYFSQHFPAAIVTVQRARDQGKIPYRWMTHSWLATAYRNCNNTKINTRGPGFPSDVTCPTPAAVASFEAAARRGDISWHAFPFNAEPELFTPELFDAALNLTFEQDAAVGHAPRRTLSQRDVPGPGGHSSAGKAWRGGGLRRRELAGGAVGGATHLLVA